MPIDQPHVDLFRLDGETVVAYVVKNEPDLTINDVHKYLVEHANLANYKTPHYYRFIDELPYTATGKKKHYVMREQGIQDREHGLLQRGSTKEPLEKA